MNDHHFKFTPQVLLLPFFFVLTMWTVFWAEKRFGLDLGIYGIYPRDLEGLRGIVLSPFLHGDIGHLYNNSLPLLILLAAISYFYLEVSRPVVFYGILLSGAITWLIGRGNYHIGASGLIYVLVSFIFFKGLITKYYRLVALSLFVIFLYGSMAWYIFPDVDNAISWEGHLAGLITGFIFAVRFKTPEYTKMIRYEWESPDYDPQRDKFMQRFDENGNFVNLPLPEPEPGAGQEETPHEPQWYRYHYIPKGPQQEQQNP
jgi:membrane associated rhomboid family serine protease